MLVGVGAAVVCAELPGPVPQVDLGLVPLPPHHVDLLCHELVLGLRVELVAAHAYHHVVLPAILVQNFSLLQGGLLEMVAIAALEVELVIVLEFNVGGLLPLNLQLLEGLGVVVGLSLGHLLGLLLGKTHLEVSRLEVKDPVLVHTLVAGLLMRELLFGFGVVVPRVSSQKHICPITSLGTFAGCDWLGVVGGRIGSLIVVRAEAKDQVGVPQIVINFGVVLRPLRPIEGAFVAAGKVS